MVLYKVRENFKGPFCDPAIFKTQFNRHRQNKLISKFSVDSEVAFVSYAHVIVSYLGIGHYFGHYNVNIINSQFDRLFRQTDEFARKNICTQTLCS